ncbi:EscU/YscU/HrcU family type III secretion system export apparatus switch protein, partial [Enterococcus faecium]|uniref:EscU/YscU/HrcU family type III secretion system export apparatus switch protein n=1 Tax=Enterococcus faecium TaxID=1352 RepID=UPI003F523DC1
LLSLLSQIELMLIGVLGVPLLLLLIAGVGSNLIQHRLVFSSEPLSPKFSKISPMAGFQRLFGKQAGANFLKGIFKVLLL